MALIPGTLPTGTKYPNEPQTLLDTFASYLTAPEVKKNRPAITTISPSSGQTVKFNLNGQDETLFLDINSSIANLTIEFPGDTASVVGQTISVFPKSAITTLVTYTNGARVPAAPTTLAAGRLYQWRKVDSTNWIGWLPNVSGWAAATGTATRTTFATSNVTTAQLAERVKALIDDLTTIGILRS